MTATIPDAINQNMALPVAGAVVDKARAFFSAIFTGSDSPEGVVTAPVGSFYFDLANGVIYGKQTGSGNTGWVAGAGP